MIIFSRTCFFLQMNLNVFTSGNHMVLLQGVKFKLHSHHTQLHHQDNLPYQNQFQPSSVLTPVPERSLQI